MTEKIQKGSSLSEAMQSHERLFGPLICAVVKATEPAGTLKNGLSKCADYYEKNAALHAMCVKKLRYPLLIVFAATGIISTLFYWFIPEVVHKISVSDMNLAVPTKIALALVSGIHNHLFLLAGVVAGLSGFIFLIWRLNSQIPLMAKANWKLPWIGTWLRYTALRRFCLALSILVANGVPPGQSLRIALAESRSSFLKASCPVSQEVSGLAAIAGCLESAKILPDIIIDTMKEARSSDELADALKKTSEFYQEKIEALFNAIILIVEPVVIAILGLLGTGILVALYLPFGFIE
jgi:type II secretory pathway component PulF